MRRSLFFAVMAFFSMSWRSGPADCNEAFVLNGVRYSIALTGRATLDQASVTVHNESSRTVYVPAAYTAYVSADHPILAIGYMNATLGGPMLGQRILLMAIPAGASLTIAVSLDPAQNYPMSATQNVYIDFIDGSRLTKQDIKDLSILSDQYIQAATTLVATVNCP